MAKLKINPLFFVAIIIVYFTGYIYPFFVMFITLFIHELVHLFFIAQNKIIVESITLEPFGISIQAANLEKASYIVYLSAPIFNLILGVIFYLYNKEYFNYFMITNFSLGIFNLIPTKPFDGGRALELFLIKRHSEIYARKIMASISFVIATILILVGIYGLFTYNFSVVIIGIFILYSALAEKKLTTNKVISHYTSLEARGNMEKSMNIVTIAVPEDYKAHKLLKEFSQDNYYIVKVICDGVVIKTVTETQIVRKIINSKDSVRIKDC